MPKPAPPHPPPPPPRKPPYPRRTPPPPQRKPPSPKPTPRKPAPVPKTKPSPPQIRKLTDKQLVSLLNEYYTGIFKNINSIKKNQILLKFHPDKVFVNLGEYGEQASKNKKIYAFVSHIFGDLVTYNSLTFYDLHLLVTKHHNDLLQM